jgi:hypothetical protein
MLDQLFVNQLVTHGVFNLALAAIVFFLIKEEFILREEKTITDILTESILRNVVVIASIMILAGLIF